MTDSKTHPSSLKKDPTPAVGRKKSKVLIVDDHPIIRKTLAMLINLEPDLVACGGAEDCTGAKAAIQSLKPDLVIVDLTLKFGHGLDLIKDIHQSDPRFPSLVFSVHEEDSYAERALRAGAKGYVTKQAPIQVILTAIRTVLRGEVYVSPTLSARVLKAFCDGKSAAPDLGMERLTDRELQVLEFIGQGQTPTAIASNLHLHIKTVETYQARIKQKLNLDSAAKVKRFAELWLNKGDED